MALSDSTGEAIFAQEAKTYQKLTGQIGSFAAWRNF